MTGVHELWLRTLPGRNSEIGLPITRDNWSLRGKIGNWPRPLLPGHPLASGDLDSTAQGVMSKSLDQGS